MHQTARIRPDGGYAKPVPEPAHVIVVGNQKGGTGKSTTALHLAVALLRSGCSVGTIDLDIGQETLSRYLANRRSYGERHGIALPMPKVRPLALAPGTAPGDTANRQAFVDALADLAASCRYVVIDTPGRDDPLSRLGHSFADTLITPINDSFVDLDLLGEIDPDTLSVLRPSRYAEMVFQQRKQKMVRQRRSIDWVVMRNRLTQIAARNKSQVGTAMDRLAERIGFRIAPGFGERVIFRELFLKGLTLMDLGQVGLDGGLTMSHLAARQEVRALLDAIGSLKPVAADPAAAAAAG